MAKQKRRRQRPFRREVLDAHARPELRPRLGPGAAAWYYTLTLPLEEIRPQHRQIATAADLVNLETMFAEHFGGFTRLSDSPGYGLRDPTVPEQPPQMNNNASYAVLSSPVPEADLYFRALREELEEALDEGVILIHRQDVWIP